MEQFTLNKEDKAMASKKVKLEVHGKTFSVSQAVDGLGAVRARKRALEELEKEFTEALKPHMDPATKVFGENFSCKMVESTRRTLDAVKTFKKLGKDKFLKACSVTLTAAKKVLSEEDIDKLAIMGKPTISIKTDAIPRAHDMGAPEAFDEIELQ